jgi:Putative transposase
MPRCKAWSRASCCARSSAACASTVPAAAPQPAWARWFSSTASARRSTRICIFIACIIDGVFEAASAADGTAGVVFHAASGLAAAALLQVQARVRQQVLRACVRRGLLEHGDAEEMGGWDHGGGFSVDASVRIEGADQAGLERLLRYCARPPFALEHLKQPDIKTSYRPGTRMAAMERKFEGPVLAESTHSVVLPQSGLSRPAGASQPPAGL